MYDIAMASCVALLKLGDVCQGTVQCGSGTVCSGTCQCSSATYRPLVDGINCAQGIQVLGGNCTIHSQCGGEKVLN